ncbi:acyltransferase family protein [Frigoribacterium faeni]|uniref:acyltransferase family protein n=1 Tax=Frigoribacterium faeni TaxID=145483 RepID=UPI00141AE9AF|nr:acyltransferase family protein [Frigoribacterium faeni]NIJ05817.1 peptidoglycan/LPS O-acetylase OafA/YrhL [Frigoribacterium faeni]
MRFRADVQGLRALAVTAVVVDHVSGVPGGGFVGVDVFFVLSGYLITGLLLREHARNGRISMAGFWRRRARRLLPSLVVVVGITLFAVWRLLPERRLATTLVDTAWSAVLAANWRFAAVGTDYFGSTAPPSPLQHLWSLAVEEQFYLLWPVLVIAVLWLAGRRSAGARGATALTVVLGVIAVASFAWSLHETADSPTTAYFSTLSRAWELAVGGLVALTASWWRRVPAGVGTVAAWAGVALVVASFWVVDETSAFPGPWALLPVLATALVIVAGEAGTSRPPVVLTNPVSRYVGAISYSLYLWHFPVLVVVQAVEPGAAWLTYPLALGCSVVAHHLVEVPLMQAPALFGHGTRQRRVHAWAHWAAERSTTLRNASLGALLMVSVVLAPLVVHERQPPTAPPVFAADGADVGAAGTEDAAASPDQAEVTAAGPAVQALQAQVQSALAATSWPALDPDPGHEIPGGDSLACGSLTNAAAWSAACTFGSPTAPHTAVLVGDSTGVHELDALVDLVEQPDSGWRLIARARFGCPFLDLRTTNAVADQCAEHISRTIDEIQTVQPDALIVTDTFDAFDDAATGAVVTPADFASGLERLLAQVDDSVGQLVFLTSPPPGGDLQTCYRPGGTPADCVSRVSARHGAVLFELGKDAEARPMTIVDVGDLVCFRGVCPSFVGTVPMKIDHVHFSGAFAAVLSPALGELLRSKGVLVPGV